MVEVAGEGECAPHERKISDVNHIVYEVRSAERIFQGVQHLISYRRKWPIFVR